MTIIPPARYTDVTPPLNYTEESEVAFALAADEELVEAEEPKDYYEAISCKDKKLWKAAAGEQMMSLDKNEIWVFVY